MGKIENAKITNVSLTMVDHGVLTFYLTIEGAGWGCNVGSYVLGHGYLGSKYWDARGSGLVCLMKIMDTIGAEKWEDLEGKYVRVETAGWGGTIHKIGHIINEKWFDIKEFFKDDGQELFILDERPHKEELGELRESQD